MIGIIIKAAVGVIFVIAIALLTQTKYYFLAGVLPLFPSLALVSHYIVGTTNTTAQFRNVIIFGIWSLVPYFLYLVTVYYLHNKTNLQYALGGGLLAWIASALIMISLWNH